MRSTAKELTAQGYTTCEIRHRKSGYKVGGGPITDSYLNRCANLFPVLRETYDAMLEIAGVRWEQERIRREQELRAKRAAEEQYRKVLKAAGGGKGKHTMGKKNPVGWQQSAAATRDSARKRRKVLTDAEVMDLLTP